MAKMEQETIKIVGYSEGDRSVGITEGYFSIDTGLFELEDNDKEFIIKTMIRDMWELHDNGTLHFDFSDEADLDAWGYSRRFGYEENLMLTKNKIIKGLK